VIKSGLQNEGHSFVFQLTAQSLQKIYPAVADSDPQSHPASWDECGRAPPTAGKKSVAFSIRKPCAPQASSRDRTVIHWFQFRDFRVIADDVVRAPNQVNP
jgi:hypothetical protein